MVSTASKRKAEPSFAISYGLAGGMGHGRKITKLLKEAGWEQAKQVSEADIIIAHSAGCWLIPLSAQPKLVVYVGMPLAQSSPRRTWAATNRLAFQKAGIKNSLKVRIKGSYYYLREPRRNWGIIRRARTGQPVIFSKAQSVFIANRHDPWTQSETLQTYLDNRDWAFINLPGPHGDMWHHPERYVAIIKHYARLLA
jgi:hypothetical protein